MTAYYNEIDPYAAGWLRNLIAAGRIAAGDVDERSIREVKPDDIKAYTQCHFFAGIGVWSAALRLAGWADDRPVWTGSCPCQPFSAAGKGGGFGDERHLWPDLFRLIAECKPGVVFGEQVASKDGLAWLDLVQADLEGADYASAAVDLCAAGVGAPHIRQRLWFAGERLANADDARLQGPKRGGASGKEGKSVGHAVQRGGDSPANNHWGGADWLSCRDGKCRPVEPGTFPLAHGAASRVGRLRAYGNAIVAQAAEEVIAAYMADEASDLI